MKVTVPAGTAATVYVPATAAQTFVATTGNATPKGRVTGYQVFEVEPGAVSSARALRVKERSAARCRPRSRSASAPREFGAFTPGVAKGTRRPRRRT